MTSRPSNQGWAATHSSVACPSACSLRTGTNSPPDPKVPRQLWMTTW